MLNDYIQNAEYLVQSAKSQSCKHKPSLDLKWKSLHAQLQDTYSQQLEEDDIKVGTESNKGLRLLNNPLPKLCQNNKNLTRLIVNLFPFDCGYSLMLKTCSSQYTETIQLPYDEFELLNYIDNEQIPPLLVERFNLLEENMFHSGCVIAEIRDYRIAASLTNFETRYVLLQPTQQTLLGDVDAIAAETSHLFTWERDEKSTLESYLLLATSDPLCLTPSPGVQVMKNMLYNEKRTFKRHPIKRHIRRHGVSAMLRRKHTESLPAQEPLKLFDFLKKSKKKREEANLHPGDIRLPKEAVDLWKKPSVDLALPSGGIDVLKYAKPLDPTPIQIEEELFEVQQVLLQSQNQHRDVFSHISIYQRPSDMQYFGKLQSNKYFQPSSNSASKLSNCRFFLGTENRANLYILQYQELFAEDGRRPATVLVNRPLQKDKVKYEIPHLRQPWQLEQDQSLYAVGTINSIPLKHWHRLRVHNNPQRPRLPSNHQLPGNPQQRNQPSSNQNAVGSSQQLSSTTPTLNAATLQSEAPSPFVFPPSQAVHPNDPNSPRQLPTPVPHVLERKTSSDTYTLLNSAHHTSEVQSGKRSRQSSIQDIFNFSTSNVAGSQSRSNSVDTPTIIDGKTINIDSLAAASQLNQGNTISLQFQNPSSQPHQYSSFNSAQLQTKNENIVQSKPMGAATVVHVPSSVNTSGSSGAQQLAINILSNLRGKSTQNQIISNVQQIQLAPSRPPPNTVSINTAQVPADFALQLAAPSSQSLNKEKAKPSTSGIQLATNTSGISTPGQITLVANNNQIVGTMQAQQLSTSNSSNQSATLTFNPRTQILTANVHGTNIQQPFQFLQVGSSTIQPLPVRIPSQQVNQVRTSSATDASKQLTLAQHLQLPPNTGVKRNRKRKATPDHGK